ncbi:MAG: DUF4830 domain-containing protein [Oscillospiraceae bacterium]|nr:DUF4830 domain-containing protein [Oscillospiraceae bacterium]
MFVKTVKIKSLLKILLILMAIAGVLLLAVTFVNRLTDRNKIILEDIPAQIAFLESLGWETSGEPVDIREVIIPEEWNSVFEEYNDLQKQQGFDLDKYRGKQATIYTYQILNYDGAENVVANLMVFDGRLIAGDVCSAELGGFMQGLCKVN